MSNVFKLYDIAAKFNSTVIEPTQKLSFKKSNTQTFVFNWNRSSMKSTSTQNSTSLVQSLAGRFYFLNFRIL